MSEHSDAEAWHAPVEFEPLGVAPGDLKLTRKDTYGWKPQLRTEIPGLGRSVGEVELAHRLRSEGYEAYWVDNFGSAPAMWRPWTRRAKQLPAWLLDLDAKIREHDLMQLHKRGGWPDVVAWVPGSGEARFVEYKGPGDKVRASQDAWFRAALNLNVLPDKSYVVAKWDPSPVAVLRLAQQKEWQAD
ncbi:MAG: VRR-NUC domain-containing protein [Actinomycetota bacterium]|nr:VRR-NUC domain-containing protein [Actinomycetota bacterium]